MTNMVKTLSSRCRMEGGNAAGDMYERGDGGKKKRGQIFSCMPCVEIARELYDLPLFPPP